MKSFIQKSISLVLVAMMLFGAGPLAGIETSLLVTKAQAASYPAISALKIPRIKQISGDSACYLCSFASVEAYHRGTYGGTTFSYGTDYSQSIQLYKDIKSANGGSVGWSSTIHNKYEYSKDNSPTLADIYKQLSLGKPVIVYGTSSTYGTHASVIIGYNGSSSTLEQSGFTVMEINASYWKNSQSIFNSYANNPQTYSTGGGNCYVTLSSWLSKASRTMDFITYRTKAPSYTLTYNANGGSGAPASQTGTEFMISSTVPTKTGYTFLGWSKSSTATSASYSAKDYLFDVTSNITLYAVWRKNTLKVYYNANGGSISSDDYKLSSNIIYKKSDSTKYYQSWTYNSAKSNGLTNASTFGIYKTGYSFAGWGTSSSGGTIFDSNDTSIVPTNLTSSIKNGDCSITLYAQWKKNTYTLTYNANGGSNPPSAQSGSTSYTISSTKPTKSGYSFLGWAKSSSATSASYTAGDKITLTANTTLYAVWSKNTCKVSFILEDGTTYTSKTITKGNSIGSLPTPTKSGYEFVGWDTQSNTSLARVTASSTFSSDTKLYAKWSDTYYGTKITFVLNGGSISGNTSSYKFDGINISRGDSDTVLFNCNGKVSPANQWGVEIAVNSDGKVIAKRNYGDETALTVPTGGFILSAHLPVEGTNAGCKFIDETSVGDYVYYNGNTLTAYRCSNHDVYLFYSKYTKGNNPIGVLPTPTKSGYRFVGWDTSNTSSVARITSSTVISSNTTLYAVWEKIPVAEASIPTIKIKNNPEITTIKYGDILQLTAEVTNMPEGAYIVWYYNGTEGAFEYGKSDDTLTCMILSLDNGSTEITAVVVDENGNPILDADGNEISDSQTIKSKAGFWQILISLFKSLFGFNRIIVQAISKFI